MVRYYHGSAVAGITRLKACSKLHDSEEIGVYLTDSIPYALFYIWDAKHTGYSGKHVTGWMKDGVAYYEEQFPDQLQTFYQGVSGYLYGIEECKMIQPVANRDNMFFGAGDVAIVDTMPISDVYSELLRHESEGKLVILRYREQTLERQNALIDMMAQAIIRNDFYKGNMEKQAFMKKYFVDAWQKVSLSK